MVALLRPDHLPVDGPEVRPHLRLVNEAPRPERARQRQSGADARPRNGVVAVLGVAVLMALVLLRVAQGTPPAASWEGLAETAYASPAGGAVVPIGPAEEVRVVEPGDTLWAIALELRPNADPRPLVDALAERNGGTALQVGQRLVIPADLLAD